MKISCFTNIDRSVRPYTYNPDINGNFQVRNLYASQNQNIEADYVLMHFNLQHYGSLGDKEIHIYGNFNNWTIDQTTYMRLQRKNRHLPKRKAFQARLL